MAPASEERAIAVKKSGSMHIVALQLSRRLDAQGNFPYTMSVARCSRAPNGLHMGLLAGGTQAYCVDTMRQTGDAMAAKGNKGFGKGAGASRGWGGNSGWGNNQPGQNWGSNQPQQNWGSNQQGSGSRGDGWDNARRSQDWGKGGSAASSAAPGPAASEQAEMEEEAKQQQTGQGAQWQDGGVDPWDDWAQDA